MKTNEQLLQIAALVAQQHTLPEDQLIKAFLQLNITDDEAREWLQMMPLAFARAAYRFSFSGSYPHDEERRADNLPGCHSSDCYARALAYASDCGAMDYLDPDVFNRVVKMSPEFEFLRNAK